MLVSFYTNFMTRRTLPEDQSFLNFSFGLQKTHQRDPEVRWFVGAIYGCYKVVFVHVSALFANVMLDYFWFASSRLQTWRLCKYNFLIFPFSHPLLDILNFLTSMTTAVWNFSLFLLFHTLRAVRMRSGPADFPLKPWWTGCKAAPLIAVMVLRALSQTVQILTSPPLNVHCNA